MRVLQVAVKPSVKAVSSTAAMDLHLSAAPTTPMWATSSRKLTRRHGEHIISDHPALIFQR